ncbi:hypothetical protein HNQ50_003621 [Silvimonas terrae]|uniref:Uncharacterized protein n=1 Tax=Silvimonas terrae TaxID=300266 RepID=A0A840RID7_9NEIS|nr:hypothetical protein [Silvimonas terrae]
MNQVSASARRQAARPAIDTICAVCPFPPVNAGVSIAFFLRCRKICAFVV